MHELTIASYKKIAIHHSSKIAGGRFEDLSDSRVQSIAVEPHQFFLFRTEERDNIYPLPIESGNEFTKVFDRPSFAPHFPAADKNSNGRSPTAPARQLLYSFFPLLVLSIRKK